MKFTDLVLQTVTKLLVFIILTVAVYLFFSGHHHPGGGFVGGLITASAIVLLCMAFDIQTVRQIIPVDFKAVAAFGVLLAVGTGAYSLLSGEPFLNQTFGVMKLPLLGETEFSSAVLFDVGVFFAVLGTVIMIILSLSEEQ